ncbi:DMT family transporter [Hugenholtzia roseola]|uniref:DMT family transporter n=1 Tax=Hugenholtzia roseola TaxID=1002 RepID=UPI0004261D3A|nr:DMT family transporter [Hugenholtzia roseola]
MNAPESPLDTATSPQEAASATIPPLAWLILGFLSLVWGSSFILMKRGLEVFTATQVGAIRIFLAFLFFLPFILTRLKRIKGKDWLYVFLSGLLGNTLPAFFFATAQTQLLSSITGILNALTPLFTALVAVWFFGEKLQKLQLLGLGIALSGSVLLSLGEGFAPENLNLYVLFVVAATLCYGVSVNLVREKLGHLSPLTIAAGSFFTVGLWVGIYLFSATNFVEVLQTESLKAYRAMGFLAILAVLGSAISLILFNRLIQMTNAIFASIVTYLIPIVALIWGLLDGESLAWGHYFGMGLILVGVYLLRKKVKK